MSIKKNWERNWTSKSKRLQWVVPKWHSHGRNKISWVCCYVSSREHAHIFELLTSVIRLSKYIAFIAHVRFKIFGLFNFEHVGSNIEV